MDNLNRTEYLIADLSSAINSVEEEFEKTYIIDDISEAIIFNIRNNIQLLENYYIEIVKGRN